MDQGHKARLLSFRSGDRSEYIALYFISRFAYINSVPRQEDFGLADFICFLGKQVDKFLFAENAFLVQVKSEEKEIKFNEDATVYLKNHANLPFFILVINKKLKRIKIFSTWRLWYILSIARFDKINNISFHLNKNIFEDYNSIYNMDSNILNIALANPILNLTYDQIDNNQINFYEIVKFWLQIENMNLMALRSHKTFCYGAEKWCENELPSKSDLEIYYAIKINNEYLEHLTAKCLTALSLIKNVEKDAISRIMQLIPENYFDEIGKKIRNSSS